MIFLFFLIFYITKDLYNAKWLKIFYHNSTGGIYFSNISHALKSDLPQLYSILGEINDNFKINGYFEFLLEYPEYSGYNRWKQQINPKDNPEFPNQQAIGYQEVSCSWKGQYFGGLVRSSRFSWTLLDGSTGYDNWYYAIGIYAPPSIYCYPKFPGPEGSYVFEAYLWIRINNQIPLNNFLSYNSCKYNLINIKSFFFKFIFL